MQFLDWEPGDVIKRRRRDRYLCDVLASTVNKAETLDYYDTKIELPAPPAGAVA